MPAEPTTEQLEVAHQRMRALPRCGEWPATLAEALQDKTRAKLLRLLAQHPGPDVSPPVRTEGGARPRRTWRPPQHAAAPQFDPKRAASGERDE
uniref:Uncharacterized protein n=1 Tax=biofilter metagenome TaxID=1070537 RepID=A0A1A7GDQ1_9ZZZZ